MKLDWRFILSFSVLLIVLIVVLSIGAFVLVRIAPPFTISVGYPSPVPTEMVVPSPIPSPVPTVTPFIITATPMPTPTLVPVTPKPTTIYDIPLVCADKAVTDYLIDNSVWMVKLSAVNQATLGHFNVSNHGTKYWVDKGDFDDAYLKVQRIRDEVESLTPPEQLKGYQYYQVLYLKSLEKAYKIGQKGDASDAWGWLNQANYYKGLMWSEAAMFYTCGIPLMPTH